MPISIPRPLVEFLLLGPEDDRRQLQDSPILGDVWVEFARRPADRLELLITPYREQAAGKVAATLSGYRAIDDRPLQRADIAFLQGIVAATMTFEDVLRFIVPITCWWQDRRAELDVANRLGIGEALQEHVGLLLEAARVWRDKTPGRRPYRNPQRDVEAGIRYIALAGLMLWARRREIRRWELLTTERQILRILNAEGLAKAIVDEFLRAAAAQHEPDEADKRMVWTISLNRRATSALTKSVAAVKADAARTLFTVNCSEIVWAVIDSGIDAAHPAFQDAKGVSRVRKCFDFTSIRKIVSLDNLYDGVTRATRADVLLHSGLRANPSLNDVDDALKRLAKGAEEGRTINWEIVEPLIELVPGPATAGKHGTHVAGILGARNPTASGQPANADWADGMCPEIALYDFRVLAPDLMETEFAIIAALQYIRYVNERNSFMTVHGANLSLSIPHDVRNYACGRTPVCNECERLVNSGVVVVAAAGNRGYQNFETKEGLYEGYAAFSVTDPGNADGVITVGATHRYWPHTYGVSFFSSRGPTGDGRLKPDLVAPGERIRAPLPGGEWGDLDGTSMAAPHVSGAAAMLMARYSELIGQPRRIKQILCESATDLGRERTFQGHGMLDVLRAFQKV